MVRRVFFEGMLGRVGEVASPEEHQSGNTEVGRSIRCPRIEHVGDNAISFEILKQLLDLSLEQRQALSNLRDHVGRSANVKGLDPVGEANLGSREFHRVDPDGTTTTRIAIGGILEQRGSCWGGDW